MLVYFLFFRTSFLYGKNKTNLYLRYNPRWKNVQHLKNQLLSSYLLQATFSAPKSGTDGTAALTQQCLNEGAKYVTLLADMKNPTANGIYQKVGYRPVSDMKLFEFESKEQEVAA